MKLSICIVALVMAPTLASAQSPSGGLTRAEVRAQLVQIEQAGYYPGRKDLHYPDSIQRAEARLNSSKPALHSNTSGYGYPRSAATETGSVMTRPASRPLYSHH